MKLFIDTANIKEITQAYEMGIISGVTTNPSIIAKEGKNIYVAMEATKGENDYKDFELFWGRFGDLSDKKRYYFEHKMKKLRTAKSGMEKSQKAKESPEHEKICALILAGERIMEEHKI